jgi:hypothetical protein
MQDAFRQMSLRQGQQIAQKATIFRTAPPSFCGRDTGEIGFVEHGLPESVK